MFLLDTNVISELRHGKPNQSNSVRAWAGSQPDNLFFLSAVTILELEKGIQTLERNTPPQGSALRKWLNGVRSVFKERILPFNEHTAEICAGLHIPNPRLEGVAKGSGGSRFVSRSGPVHAYDRSTAGTKIGPSEPFATPSSERDAMIAATAIEHGFTMVTRNVSDFDYKNLSILNPWSYNE